jgi:hypothetical protein
MGLLPIPGAGGGFPGGGGPGGFPGGGGPGGFPGGGGPGGFPGGGGSGGFFPGGGFPGGGFPGGFPGGGGPGGFPGGGFPGGFPGGLPGSGTPQPTSPPPQFVPELSPSLYAVDPGGIRRCLYRNTYVWQNNGEQYWFFPVFVGRESVAGFRWFGFTWGYFGIDLRRIQSFTCF